MYTEIHKCRLCGNTELVSLIHLGEQTLTGVFPKSTLEQITSGPLELVKCYNSENPESCCGLVQLRHSYNLEEMYGDNYGYRSGLNRSMVNHLHAIVDKIKSQVVLSPGDVVIDIGGNDSTLLQAYPEDAGLNLTVIDPTGNKFKKYYKPHIQLIPDFFSAKSYFAAFQKKAKVVTSISMFYDLEDPLSFVQDVFNVLDDEGIWVFEQSYLPLMIDTTSYDTICHEHLEYYCLRQIQWMFDRVGFRILDVDINDVNGGSFRVTAAKQTSGREANQARIQELFNMEEQKGFHALEIYKKFAEAVVVHKGKLLQLLSDLKSQGKKVLGYGASTKGNVLLQYCGLGPEDLHCIAEVNEDKFGSFTPHTNIAIVSEAEAKSQAPDYFIVLPWHFRKGIVERESAFLEGGGKLIFPLPEVEIVGK